MFVVVAVLSADIVINQGATFVTSVPQSLDTLRTQYESLSMPIWLRSNLDLVLNGIAQGSRPST